MAESTKQSLPIQSRRAIARRTVQEPDNIASSAVHILQIATAADEAPAWWSKSRDGYLDRFWPTEPYLAGAVYSIMARNASFRYEFTGPENEVKWSQDLLAQANFGAGWQDFITKITQDLLCLAGTTRVHLAGDRLGKRKTIAKIVKDKDTGPILSVDDSGHIVERKIIEWHKTPLGGRRWWWISLKKASLHSGKRLGGIFMTEDHPVLTSDGWVYARDIKPGMKVATGDPEPSDEQCEVLTGSQLGDGSIRLIRKRSSLSFTHSVKQEDWLDFKLRALSGFQWTGRWVFESQIRDSRSLCVGISSRGSLALTKWRNDWYPDGKKIVPRGYVERYFSPRMLAVWYCDDGTLHRTYTKAGNISSCYWGSLYTNAFTEEDVAWLTNLLIRNGIDAVWNSYNNGGKKYPVIRIPAKGMRKFVELVGPYIPPVMRYKLPDDAPEYDPSLWELESAKAYFDEVVESRPRDYRSGGGGNACQTTYHIGVEDTGCFVAANTVVHNTQGNGAAFEIIRPAKARVKNGDYYDAIKVMDEDTGEMGWMPFDTKTGKFIHQDFKLIDNPIDLPIGIAHLDISQCVRSGDIDFPIIYQDLKGKRHKMAYWQVCTLEDMPSPREEMHNVGHCLHRDSAIHMAEGSTRRIVDLVRSKSTEKVLTIDTHGNVVSRCIVGWYINERDNRHWVNLRCKYAKSVRGWAERNSWVTNDHPILTPSGWVDAGDLNTGDKVVTGCLTPNKKQRALLIGTVLGDGSITKHYKTPRMSLGHKITNSDWIETKIRALADFEWSSRKNRCGLTDMINAECKTQPSLHEYYDAIYPNGKRTIPIDLVRECLLDDVMRPIFLMAWYLDDGHIRDRNAERKRPSMSIACVSADPSLVIQAAQLFTDLGYKTTASRHFKKRYPNCRNLLFSVDASEKIFDEIARYVPLSMRYKLPVDAQPYDPSVWDFGPMDLFVDEVVVKTDGHPQASTTYCIDVEGTHNFISSNIVMHNCAVDRGLRLSQIIRDMLIYKHEKVSGRFARAIHITNVDAMMLQDAVDQATASADSKGLMRYSQPVILATMNPDGTPAVATINLATLPDGFSEEESMKWYVAGLANAFGVDYGFLAPLPGNKLGTSTQAETQERQAKGKSSSLFMQMMTYKFSYNGILPRCVQFKFGVPDPFEESEKDRALARRARAYSTLIQSDLLPPVVVRQIAADAGDIDPKYLEMMGEADLTPIVTLSGTERPCPARLTPKIDPRQLQLWKPEEEEQEQPNGND